MSIIDYLLRKEAMAMCPRCGGTGTFLGGETCYYCKGKGTV